MVTSSSGERMLPGLLKPWSGVAVPLDAEATAVPVMLSPLAGVVSSEAKVRWSLFVAATGRKMRKTLDWDPYFDVAAKDLPYAEKLKQYAAIARKRLDADRFQEFCDKHLGALPEIAHQFRTAPEVFEIRIMRRGLGDDLGGQRHHLEIVKVEQAGAQAVVDIVGVIGDVIGNRSDLRLHRRKAP